MGDPLEDPNEANEKTAENDDLDKQRAEELLNEQQQRDEESNLVTRDPDVPLPESD